MWILPLTSPNSGVKIHGGDLKSVKTILAFIFSFCASFSSFYFILSTLSSDTRDKFRLRQTKGNELNVMSLMLTLAEDSPSFLEPVTSDVSITLTEKTSELSKPKFEIRCKYTTS